MGKKRSLKERIAALILALVLVVTGVLPGNVLTALAQDETGSGTEAVEPEVTPEPPKPAPRALITQKSTFRVYEIDSANINENTNKMYLNGATVIIYDASGNKVAEQITAKNAQNDDGYATVEAQIEEGTSGYQYEIKKDGFIFNGGNGKKSFTWDETSISEKLEMAAIKLDKTDYTLKLNNDASAKSGKIKLEPEITNNAKKPLEYSWESADTNVVTVDQSGNITAVNEGNAEVKVTRNGKSATANVKVIRCVDMTINATPNETTNGTATNENVSEVNLSVELPSGYEYNGQIQFYYQKTGETAETPIGDPQDIVGGNASVTFNEANNIIGKITFIARYTLNDDIYEVNEKRTNEITYKKTKALTFNDAGWNGNHNPGQSFNIPVAEDSKGSRTLHFTSDNENVATVDEATGVVTIHNAGTATIKVQADENDNYTATSNDYTVTVNKVDLGNLNYNDFTWTVKDAVEGQELSKVYDGTDEITLVGKKTTPQNEVIEITVTAKLNDSTVGQDREVSLSADAVKDIPEFDNYDCTWEEIPADTPLILTTPKINIIPRPVYVKINNDKTYTSVEYAESFDKATLKEYIAEKILENNTVVLVGDSGKLDENSGLVADADLETLKLEENVSIKLNDLNTYYVGTYQNAVYPEVNETLVPDTNPNYKLTVMKEDGSDVVANEYCGTVEVTKQVREDNELWENDITPVPGTYTFVDNEGIIWAAKDGSVTLDNKNSFYTNVVIADNTNEMTFEDAKDNEITDASTLNDARLYLKNDNNVETRTTSVENDTVDNKIPAGKIKVDAVSPEVEFKKLGNSSVMDENYAFTDFTGASDYTAEIAVTDVGSGVKASYYKLVPVASAAEVNTAFNEAADNDTGWLPTANNASITIKESDAAAGYYIVLVKAVDNVDNAKVYASNGLVKDITKPTVALDIITDPENGIYNGNIEYKINVSEPEKEVLSGIDRIEVTVKSGETVVPGDKASYQNTYTLERADLDALKGVEGGEYTFDELANVSSYTINGGILAEACQGNNVTLTVTAFDRAGNEASNPIVQVLKMDAQAPTITVSYDNNTPDAVHTTYFKADRTMTIVYQDRNFDTTEVKATFNLGNDTIVTLKDILDGKVDGIKAEFVSDTQKDIPDADRTDDRQITYKVTFGKENADLDFTVVPSIEDISGNVNDGITYAEGTAAATEFTVDRKVPEIAVSCDNNDVQNGKYFNSQRTMRVVYTERNFDESRLTFDAGTGAMLSLDELRAIEGIRVAAITDPNAKEDTHTYEFTFGEAKKDLAFKFIPYIKDMAGNDNENVTYADKTEAAAEFVVDMVKPVLSVKYQTVDKDGNVSDIPADHIGTAVQDSMYKNKTIQAVVTIAENNFAAEDTFADSIAVAETAKDVDGTDVKAKDQNPSAKALVNWKDGETAGTKTQTFVFAEEANYTFNLTYKDMAGNEVSLVPDAAHYFTVDKTAPTGTVEVETSVVKEFLNKISFGFFGKGGISVNTTSQDNTSPVKTSAFKHYPDRDANGTFDSLTEADLAKLAWEVQSGTAKEPFEKAKTAKAYSYDVTDPEQFVPYERLEDKAGNITYLNQNGIVCETQQSDIDITIDEKAPSTSFDVADAVVFDGDVNFTVDVKDPATKDSQDRDVYSGIRSVEYEIYASDSTEHQQGSTANHRKYFEFDPKDRQEVYTVSDVVSCKDYNSNSVTIWVKVIDNAGNVSVATKELKIDTTAPQIEVSYDLNADEVKNSKYFNADRTMTLKYTERNINEDGITFDITAGKDNYKGIKLAELKKKADALGLVISDAVDSQAGRDPLQYDDARTLTYTITFNGGKAKDMDYTVVPHMEDQAGNVNQKVNYTGTTANVEFTIDKVQPEMTVEYFRMNGDFPEKINVSTDDINRLYQNQTVRAVVTVNERNFSLEDAFTKEYSQVVPHFAWTTYEGNAGSVADFENAAKDSLKWTSEGVVRTQSFDFVADGDYKFGMEYTDLAGNKVTEAHETHYFTVDKTAPEVEVTYMCDGKEVTPGEIETDRTYRNKEITATFEITERDFQRADAAEKFENGQMALAYTATEVNAETDKAAMDNYTQLADTRSRWTSKGYVRTQTFTFVNDANYTLSMIYKDLAGNEVNYGKHYFTVDKTVPTGTMKIRNTVWSQFVEFITFGFFTNTSEKVTMTSDDVTAGVASTQFFRYVPGTETRGEFKGLTLKQLEAMSDEDWTDGKTTTVSGNEQVVVYEKIVDRSGNVTYISSKEGVIADNTKPSEPIITITTATPSQDIFNGDVNYTIEVTDPTVGATYSGLKEVSYEVLKDNAVTQSGNYNAELSDWTARTKYIKHSETVNAELNNSNDVKIRVKAVDWAGNVTEAEKALKIDITKPTVQITYDLNNPLNEKYFNATRTATVTVTERNFDPNQVDFTITNTDGTQPAISGWSSSSDAGVSDNATNTCTVTFRADGDYTITMNCTDRANNRSEYTQVDEFTIDQTVPEISVAFDNNNAANGTYYDSPRTATITVREHNFNGSEVQTAIQASLQAQGITAPGVNGWSNSGDVHTATVYFANDGDYSFTVDYSDLAGNPAVTHTESKFTVDQTKPEIEIFDIIDKSANNGTVAPGVRYSDVNYDVAGVKLSVKGPKHSEMTLDGLRSQIPNGESIKMADFAHEPEMDDVYTLRAEVTDLAGNVDEKSVVFSVNRFGSNFIFGKSTEEFLDKYYSNKEQDLVVTEINVDTLVHNGISYGRDGELVTLDQGSDYTVKASGSEATWKSYEYTIKAENFEKEGLYNVTIDSTDRATNVVNNKVKEANIEFVIDKTKPNLVITGIEDGEQYRAESRDVTIAVTDNVAMDNMDVFVDDDKNPAKSYGADTIMKQRGEIIFQLGSASDFQNVKAVAVDAAGNVAETDNFRVLVTSNIFVQFIRNTTLVICTAAGLAALIIIIILLARKKKSDEETKA